MFPLYETQLATDTLAARESVQHPELSTPAEPSAKELTTTAIRAATSDFGGGLRSRIGADPNACW